MRPSLLQEGIDARRRLPGLSPWPLVHLLLAMAALAARSGDQATTEELLAEVGGLTPWSEEGIGRHSDPDRRCPEPAEPTARAEAATRRRHADGT